MAGVADRVVIVTGAGGGLGRAYARLLATEGAKVVVNDLGGARDGTGAGSEMADAVVAEIRGEGGQAVADYSNVATADGAAALVKTAVDAFGTVHGLVSNAGILRDVSFAKMTDSQWHSVLAVHLNGSYNVTRAVWPLMRAQGFGRVVMATSTSGLFGNFGQANYAAAKMGIVGLVNTLAIEGARKNIKVNAVAPIAATRLTEDLATADMLAKIPPEHVAPVVGYLLTDEVETSGAIFVAGGGSVRRVALFQNAAVEFAEPPSVGLVAERWPEITDLSDASIAGL